MPSHTLIIVDVQKAFSPYFNAQYLSQLKHFVTTGNWDQVIVRYISDPEFTIYGEERAALHTFYDGNKLPAFLHQPSFLYSGRDFGYDFNDEEETEELIPGELWKITDEDGIWLYSNSPNSDMYCPTKEIEQLIYKDTDIHIVGGFADVCVEEVRNFLSIASNNPVTVHTDLCFTHTFIPDIGSALIFTNDWTELEIDACER